MKEGEKRLRESKAGMIFFARLRLRARPYLPPPPLHYLTLPPSLPCSVASSPQRRRALSTRVRCSRAHALPSAPSHTPRGARRGHPARVGSHRACFARTAATHHRNPPSPHLPCRECGARSSRLSGEQLRLPRVSTHSRHLPPCHACPRTSHARSPPTLRRSSLVSPVAPLRLCRGHSPPRRSAPRRSRPPCRMSWTRRTWQREWA